MLHIRCPRIYGRWTVSLPPKTHPSSHLKLAFKKEEMFVPKVATDVVLSVAVKFWLKKIFIYLPGDWRKTFDAVNIILRIFYPIWTNDT
jgi:hypothetical protein